MPEAKASERETCLYARHVHCRSQFLWDFLLAGVPVFNRRAPRALMGEDISTFVRACKQRLAARARCRAIRGPGIACVTARVLAHCLCGVALTPVALTGPGQSVGEGGSGSR